MKTLALHIVALVLCLLLPTLALADTYLSQETAVHADFTVSLGLHADGFAQSQAHLQDWEAFFQRLSLSGSLDGQAFFEPQSRVYMEAALCVDGEEKIPFIYDGYHSFRYLISPMFRNDSIHFQMHNFFDFMLKPYYFMELPTQYIALLLYPNATWFIADSYYTPVQEMLHEAGETARADAGEENPEAITYVVSYERLFDLCEGLNYITTDDEAYRVYCYFDAMLAEAYASYMVTDTLSNLEFLLAELDPYEDGMTVTQTADGMACTLGETEIFSKSESGGVTEITLQLPIPMGYWTTFTMRAENRGDWQNVTASLTAVYDGDVEFSLEMTGEGLPVEGALGGEGRITAVLGGSIFEQVPAPLALQFSWARTAAKLPYDLSLTVDWMHPETGLPAFSAYVAGALSARDKSVLQEANYPQDDFFSLNDMFLREHKERWAPTIGAYLLPVVLEMPYGVIDDIVNFTIDTDILISLME